MCVPISERLPRCLSSHFRTAAPLCVCSHFRTVASLCVCSHFRTAAPLCCVFPFQNGLYSMMPYTVVLAGVFMALDVQNQTRGHPFLCDSLLVVILFLRYFPVVNDGRPVVCSHFTTP